MGPTDWRSKSLPRCSPLAPVQHGVVGEAGDRRVDVAPGGSLVGPGEKVQNVEPVRHRQRYVDAFGTGRNQEPMRPWSSLGKTLLGIMPWTVFGGAEL